MVGQLLGAARGEEVIPPTERAARVELGWLVRELADDLFERETWLFPDDELPAIWSKYAGGCTVRRRREADIRLIASPISDYNSV